MGGGTEANKNKFVEDWDQPERIWSTIFALIGIFGITGFVSENSSVFPLLHLPSLTYHFHRCSDMRRGARNNSVLFSVLSFMCPGVWWLVTSCFNVGCLCLVLAFEIVSMVIDYRIKHHISGSWKTAEECLFYISLILMIYFVCGNVFLQYKQHNNLKYMKYGGRRLPLFYEVEPPQRVFGSSVTIGLIFGAVCQLCVTIVRFYHGFHSWMPSMFMYFTAGTVVFEIIQELVLEQPLKAPERLKQVNPRGHPHLWSHPIRLLFVLYDSWSIEQVETETEEKFTDFINSYSRIELKKVAVLFWS